MSIVNNPVKGWQGVPFSSVNINDAFWRPRLEVLKNVTISVCLDQCEQTNRIANFAVAGGLQEGKFEGIYYNDSDVYKVLEGAAYALMTDRDPELEAEIDRIIGLIEAAQEPDGYLCAYFTIEAPERKWTDMEKHEMYNGGHLIEAAVAYYQATGKRRLLDVACRLADHYDALFGPGKRHWAEGHEEIELALVKLFRATGEERYWKLALWLLEERGHGHGVGAIWDKPEWGPAYCQDDVPVRDIREVKGHAVRAMYLYTAMADVALASGDAAYIEALDRVWAHTAERNMYVTGGIGPSQHNEGFTSDYDLPNESAYCETCAAIAMAFWNHRMNLLHGDGKYADLVEREMFNGALAGISLSGDKFFYVNPLASKGEHHRVEWFHTSCCPTNLARFLPAIGQYAYAVTEDGIAINQYMNSETTINAANAAGGGKVQVLQSTAYPWDGRVAITILPEQAGKFAVRLRVPGWCRGYRVSLQGDDRIGGGADTKTDKGYIVLNRHWMPGDTVLLELDMPVEAIRSRPEVEANRGRVAFQRGPVVYCAEGAGNDGLAYDEFALSAGAPFAIEHREELLGGVTALRGQTSEGKACSLTPYYAWDNREAGFMQVWMREAEDRQLYRF
ncbi:glycoside hydrolase family 127 protein [Paenibacillus rhizovicinus]|uniref:Glycoside hydrolase family 127 protein n=1 Tax=Paenibacillus rhizovicinus TaxID=2704463 RepID=A0A6C0P2V9_9BACL|nr:beta-L-arabinofuranosidase domain-containing protein [Paenibacillus rhizovicinus]QHW32809.1 glycoside hydrolase family 127 protein [Paenibacillus rhizovicinus]